MKKQFLEVGEIVTVHGIRGDMRLYPWCDPGDIERSARMYMDENGETEYRVQYAKPHKNVYIVKLKGIDSPEEARKYIGKVLYMNRNDIPMKKGDYFIQDIIGLKVVDSENGTVYGEVTDVASTGANDIYCVRGADNNETWIPAIPQVIDSVDVDGGILSITPMKGLFDDED
ncbi:MAG: 16S rRNA processing protein RimM [Oscillospiraceae bacterium]|nr:16S rRNA processing protein RimM [Oscillospiraceae bacterium]